MNHREKLAHFDRHLEGCGRWKANAKPPAFWLLWKLGFEVPPPYFLSFGQAWIAAGAPFGFLFGLFFAVVFPFAPGSWPAAFFWPFVAFVALTTGALFGLCMALWWGWQRDKLELPRWEDYPPREAGAPVAGFE